MIDQLLPVERPDLQSLLGRLDVQTRDDLRGLSTAVLAGQTVVEGEVREILSRASFNPPLRLVIFGRPNTQAQLGAAEAGFVGSADAARDLAAQHYCPHETGEGLEAIRSRVILRLNTGTNPYFDAQLSETPDVALNPPEGDYDHGVNRPGI